MFDPNFNKKRIEALDILKSEKIYFSGKKSILLDLLWLCRVKVPHPYFLGVFGKFLYFSSFFYALAMFIFLPALIIGLPTLSVEAWHRGLNELKPIAVPYLLVLLGMGSLFGIIMVLLTQFKLRKHKLPRWSTLGANPLRPEQGSR